MEIPDDLRYLSSHEWCRIQGDLVTVGITDYAQQQLGDVVYIELPAAGTIVEGPGMTFANIESVKAAADVNAPCRGEIIEVHEELETMLEQLNLDPYGQGWLIRIRCAEPADLDLLLDADAYREVIESEDH